MESACGVRRFGVWVAACIGLHVLLALAVWEPSLDSGGDSAHYMMLAESLREGSGYRDAYLPGHPAHTKYPPLYPLLLAGLGALGGGLSTFKIASLVLSAAAVGLTAAWAARAMGQRVALAAAAWLAVTPVLLGQAHDVLSDALFAVLVLLALVLTEDVRPSRFGGGLAAAAAAFLTRTAGIALLAALPLAAAWHRRWRRAVAAAVLAAVVVAGWSAYQRVREPSHPSYVDELLMRDPYAPEAGRIGAADLVTRVAGNAWRYATRALPEALTGIEPARGGVATRVLGLLVLALTAAGWLLRVSERAASAESFALLYGAVVLAWPPAWVTPRFLLPLLPLLLAYAAHALERGVARAVRTRPLSAAYAGALVLLALPGAAWAVAHAPERWECVAASRAGRPCDPPEYRAYYDVARWAGEHIPPDAIVASRKPRLFYWYARRSSTTYPYSGDPARVLAGLEALGADYVVVDALGDTTPRYLLPAIAVAAPRFSVVYQVDDPPTALLRFERTGAASAAGER